eukprot:448690-Pelagomonas_calceolata.AAC.2
MSCMHHMFGVHHISDSLKKKSQKDYAAQKKTGGTQGRKPCRLADGPLAWSEAKLTLQPSILLPFPALA